MVLKTPLFQTGECEKVGIQDFDSDVDIYAFEHTILC